MPISGLSTLSILWMGQMIDLEADKSTGKLGMVSRIGTNASRFPYLLIQLALITNVAVIPFVIPGIKLSLLAALIPYLTLFPRIIPIIMKEHANANGLKPAAKMTVMIHMGFSLFFIITLLMQVVQY
jgi:1,4-dihydroxy-2-naphthoate octaprenyltransferase